MVDHLYLGARRVGEIGDGAGGQSTYPEKRFDLAVLQGCYGFRYAKAFPLEIAVLVQACRLDQAKRHDLGRAAA